MIYVKKSSNRSKMSILLGKIDVGKCPSSPNLAIYVLPASKGQSLSLFTVIELILLISRRAWEADFVAIYGDPAHFADLRASLGSRFWRYLR